ncbi:MAG: DUF4846 domain-containing protein [Polyangiales bacterium]
MRKLLLALGLCACARTEPPPPAPRAVVAKSEHAPPKAPEPAPTASVSAAIEPPSKSSDPKAHPWLAAPGADQPAAVDTLESRFAPPPGFTREPLPASSFGAFLRTLPLAKAGAPVLTHTGKVLYETHPNIAAVVAIDVGKGDLQQCADSVIRMHAEWLYGKGRRDHVYKAASGLPISFAKYLEGERLKFKDNKLTLEKIAPKIADSHGAFRSWLDDVFGWANTASLAAQATPIKATEIVAGDFVVMSGVPFGHAVLILDVARDAKGNRVLLLGQGYMPAQSFQVLRPSAKELWFPLDLSMGKLETPFWDPFPFSALRRLYD